MPRTNPRQARYRRRRRVRSKVSGTPTRSRLSIFRSLNHIYAQAIDDTQGHTLATASTQERGLREKATGMKKTEAATLVGTLVAQRLREAGITRVVFDRGGYRYHGRIKALAGTARQAGLEF